MSADGCQARRNASAMVLASKALARGTPRLGCRSRIRGGCRLVGRLEIDAPYLLIHSAEPSLEYKEWVMAHLRNVTIEVWPDSGHFLHLADPQRFVRHLLDFIATHAPST